MSELRSEAAINFSDANDHDGGHLAEARRRLDAFQDMKAALPAVRDEHARRSFELNQIEARMVETEQRLQSLQSFSLTSVLESIGGQRQRKIDEGRDLLAKLDEAFQAAQQAADEIAEQIAEMERDLVESDSVQEAFRAACDAKVESIVAAGGPDAERLSGIAGQIDALRASLRVAQKAQETGRQLLRHLESLDRAVRHARGNRRMSTALGGPVGGIIKNAVASMAPHSATRYVADGLKRFCAELGELPLGDHPDDADLIRVRAELDVFRERLTTDHSGIMGWDQIATLSPETDVQTAASCLKTFITDVEREIAELESERLAILLPSTEDPTS